MTTDPIAKLKSAGEKLPTKVRAEVLALGDAAIPRLVALLDPAGATDAAFHAVDLLVDLEAASAVPALLALFDAEGLDEVFGSFVSFRLGDFGAAAVEPALAFLATHDATGDAALSTCEALARAGVRDERVFAALSRGFEADPAMGAELLASYGDPRGTALLEAALGSYEPDLDTPESKSEILELVQAHGALGGVLSNEMQARIAGWLVALEERWPEPEVDGHGARVSSTATAAPKVGRNDACPCGSGKKYKKCHLDADEAAASEALRSGQSEASARLGGPGKDLAEYAAPLTDATGGSKQEVLRATALAQGFWDIALLRDPAARARAIEEMGAHITEENRKDFLEIAGMMVERHERMFPALHGR
jgi:hypothetical protein